MSAAPAFAGVDWGTTRFRLWLFSRGGDVLGESRSDEGLLTAARTGFERVLEARLAEVEAPAGLPVVICGMAGSRQGWVEAAYASVPAQLELDIERTTAVEDATRPVRILPGLAQLQPKPDVMRGEETQIAGAMALSDLHDGQFCLPGTHSKWATVEDGAVTRFRTAMTGELFSVIATHSILRHAVGDQVADIQADDGHFLEAVAEGYAEPGALTGLLFGIRAGTLVGDLGPKAAAARLSGLLIGTEIGASALRDVPVTLVASGALGSLYRAAFERLGIDTMLVDADMAVRTGLLMAARRIFGQEHDRHV